MTVAASLGPFVGANRDTTPITLTGTVVPSVGGTYAWSRTAGPGNGTFATPNALATQFTGTVRGKLTVKLTVTVSQPSGTCSGTKDLVVIEIGDIPEDVPDQFMDEYVVPQGGEHLVPYTSIGGELRGVYISPLIDPDSPYQWDVDFQARVNQTNGNVTITLVKPGPYLVKTVREDNAGVLTTTFFELLFHAFYFNVVKTKKGKTKKKVRPNEDLILIGTGPDNGACFWARQCVAGHEKIRTVGDAIQKINNFVPNGNQPFTVAVVDHGTEGQPSIGGGQAPSCADPVPTNNDAINDGNCAAARNAFAAACNGPVSLVSFYGCDVAAGGPNGAGQQFLTNMANLGNMQAGGWTHATGVVGIICFWFTSLNGRYILK